jgi:uncharacterized protein YecE (DUF72 family)
VQFGVVDDIRGIDFSLPPVDPASQRVLSGQPAAHPRVHVGCTGWTERGWVGEVYPSGARPEEFLRHYGHQFTTVELNSTHYGLPPPSVVQRWRARVPPGFSFAPKFPRAVSHAQDLVEVIDLAQDFCERMRLLGDRLGRAFLQLPPHFAPDRLGELAALLHGLPRTFPLAVEFRHPRFFRERRLLPTARALLASRGVVGVMTDTAGRRDVLHGTLTAPAVLLRFVGNGLHPVDGWRIEAWARRLHALLQRGVEEVHVFIHQPGPLLAAHMSNAWVERLNAVCGLSLAGWHAPGSEQLSLWE